MRSIRDFLILLEDRNVLPILGRCRGGRDIQLAVTFINLEPVKRIEVAFIQPALP